MPFNPKGKAIHLAKLQIRSETVDGNAVPDDEMQCDFIITNGQEDSYGSVMTEKTMRNYESDCNAGTVPFMLDHNTDTKSQIGRILSATYDEENKRVIATASLLRDTSSTPPDLRIDEYIRRIEKRFYDSVSVGFRNAEEICNICEKPIFDLHRADPCEHIPKHYYDGVRCTYSVDNANLGEVSLTPQPSNTGAKLYDTREWDEDFRAIKKAGENSNGEKTDTRSILEKDGLAYRTGLIDEAIKAGIRAQDNFDETLWRKRFETYDAQFIKDQTQTWLDLGNQRWGDGGRKTGGSEPDKNDTIVLPNYLFEIY